MLSDKQLAANRANAQLSTGPKSEEGKRRSSLNARRHNLTGQVTAMTDRRSHRPRRVLRTGMIKAMAPEGALELQLAQRIATDSWRLNRSSAIEDNIFALGLTDHAGDIDVDHPELHAALTAARTFTREAKSIELLTLYEQRINRSLQKNLALLQQLQATRKAERKAELEQAAKLLQLKEKKGLPENPSPNGSVFSNDQIHAVIDLQHPDIHRETTQEQHAQAA